MKSKVPVLFIIFNRLETVRQSFRQIATYKPDRLYIAADGPRTDKEGERARCLGVREWVMSHIDWECDVRTLFRNENIGCGQGPKQAIDWLFENEECGIILEDDCVADETFFPFCEQMLHRYKDDRRISIICGSNFDKKGECVISDADYFFSVVPYTWGWATWRRSWQGYDYTMSGWLKGGRNSLLRYISKDAEHRNYWRYVFDQTAGMKPHDIWDYQFFYLCYSRRQLAIVPNRNLISNIGIGDDATHNFGRAEDRMSLTRYPLTLPLTHPEDIIRNQRYDRCILDCCYGRVKTVPWHKKVKRWIKDLLKK